VGVRFTTDLGRFADSVRDASAGLPGNPSYPILTGMLIKAEKDVTLTSCDGDVMFIAKHECSEDDGCTDVMESGTVLVPGRLFTDIIRNLSGDNVKFHVKDGKAHIEAGRAKFTLRTMDTKTYPGGLTPANPAGTIEGQRVAHAIAQVSPSVSKVPANPVFTCIMAEPDGDCLALVASDRSRLACARVPWTPKGDISSALIPGWAAEKFARAALGEVTLGWDSKCFSMSCEGLEVISRGIQGEFIKWREMLPESTEGVAIDTGALTAAIRQAALLLGRIDPVELRFEGNDLYVTGAGEHGECENYLEVKNPGGDFRVKFGLGIILDGLAGCGDEAVLGFTGPGKPVKLYSDGYRYLMAPRR
jgi:DNA polymerase-3 subunit beta